MIQRVWICSKHRSSKYIAFKHSSSKYIAFDHRLHNIGMYPNPIFYLSGFCDCVKKYFSFITLTRNLLPEILPISHNNMTFQGSVLALIYALRFYRLGRRGARLCLGRDLHTFGMILLKRKIRDNRTDMRWIVILQ